jgi:hypothetical protein
VVDAQQEEILLLAQDGDRFIFGVRTGAAAFRLRRPFFALDDVFPVGLPRASSERDSLTLTGRYAARELGIGAHARLTSSEVVIPINASLGWTLWLPFQWLIEGTRVERLISAIWLAFLVIPFGYWAFYLREPSPARRAHSELAIPVLIGAALLGAGLTLIPHIFGLSVAPFLDWVATLAGALLGYALGVVTEPDRLTAAGTSGHQEQ